MVLRRPYAFLIKYFKLIHLVMAGIFGLIVYKNQQVYKYINSVIRDAVNRYDAAKYINYGVIFLILVGIALCAVIYYLLKFKDKPRRIYIVSIIGYVFVAAFIIILFSYMQGFSSNVLEQKTIRAYRDISIIFLLFQYYIIAVMIIRGLGFDIKKFNFSKDVHELNLTEADSEEIEVNTNLNTATAARLVQKQKRELGYFYKEYKTYIIAIFAIIAIILGYKGYSYFTDKLKIYRENEAIGSSNVITIKNSYYSVDEEGNNYVIVKFNIYKSGIKQQFNSGNLELKVGNKTYSPNRNICYKFNKLVTCYKKQLVSSKAANYIFVYKVDTIKKNRSYIVYNESYDVKYKVKLAPNEY